MSATSYPSHEETRMPTSGRPVLNKALFMHNVCSCLDSCSAYIQALNSFCAAGTMLAHSLVQVFHELPPYRDVAEQFLGTWEELSRATAGASAAVKTETLMALQEVLNGLEDENPPRDANKTITDNIRSVGCCMMTYIELQAQFSLCCWKSLARLSKMMSMDSMFFCPPPRHFVSSHSNEGGGSLARGQELITSVRKCFGQLLQKFSGSISPNVESSPACQMYESNEGSMQMRGGQGEPHLTSFWPLLSSSYPSSSVIGGGNCADGQKGTTSISNEGIQKLDALPNELEEVLNLLSCQPNDLSTPVADSSPYSNGGAVPLMSNSQSDPNHPWNSKDISANSESAVNICGGPPYSHFEGKRTWPRMNDHSQFGYNQWPCYASQADSVQSSQNCNVAWCSSSSGSGNRWSSGQGDNGSSSSDGSIRNEACQDSEVFSLGLDLMNDLVTTGRQRRHSSNDGCPDGCHVDNENTSNQASVPWEGRAICKTSTWPMKQSSPRPLEPGCLPVQSVQSLSPQLESPTSAGKESLLSSPWTPPQHASKDSKYTLFGQMP